MAPPPFDSVPVPGRMQRAIAAWDASGVDWPHFLFLHMQHACMHAVPMCMHARVAGRLPGCRVPLGINLLSAGFDMDTLSQLQVGNPATTASEPQTMNIAGLHTAKWQSLLATNTCCACRGYCTFPYSTR